MKNLTRILSLIILISFLASCAAPSETLDTGTHDTRTPGTVALDAVNPSPLPTETLSATITPELVQPALGHNLSAENAKTMVVEGGTWVVKNADGLVTAIWYSTAGEWVYNMENIKTTYGIVGWPEKLPIELTRESHPECFVRAPHEESLNLTDGNGVAYPDGFVEETSDGYNVFVARFVSSFNLTSDSGSIVCAQVEAGPDKALIIPLFMPNLPNDTMPVRSYKLINNDPIQREAIGLRNPQVWEIIRKLSPGQQFIFTFSKKEPLDAFFAAMKNPSGFSGQTLTVPSRIIYYGWGFPERFFTP